MTRANAVEDAHRGCVANTKTLVGASVVVDAHKFVVRLTPRLETGESAQDRDW